MSTREQRISAAQQTLKAFELGYYELGGRKVDVADLHRYTMSHITLYTPDSVAAVDLDDAVEGPAPVYRLTPLPVVSALSELRGRDGVGVLNFASAKNPGGGFLNGAQAQEESLAMCSNLYLTQVKMPEYYAANRACGTMLYTNHMIYSSQVVFIREDTDGLFDAPLTASVLTAPAVNMGEYLRKATADIDYAKSIMKDRMRKILRLFASRGNKTLILGAYGCGVFRNDPIVVAGFFTELLKDEGLEKHFDELVFAVYDNTKTRSIYTAFEQVLSNVKK